MPEARPGPHQDVCSESLSSQSLSTLPSTAAQRIPETCPRPHQGVYGFCLFIFFAVQFALKREGEADGHPLGKISFIDLAGSERGADTYDNNR